MTPKRRKRYTFCAGCRKAHEYTKHNAWQRKNGLAVTCSSECDGKL